MVRLGMLLLLVATSCGRIGFDPTQAPCVGGGDCDGLRVASTAINDDNAFATGPMLSVDVTVEGGVPPIETRVSIAVGGDCQSQFEDTNWSAHPTPTTRLRLSVEPSDGEKKLCAWARDSAGNLTLIAPSAGTAGVDADSIQYAAENVPVVSSFTVGNAETGGRIHQAGDALRIDWDISDVEALANNPVDLYLSEVHPNEDNWQLVASGIGGPGQSPTNNRGSYLEMEAPSDEPFRLRLVARDAGGNSSIAALSDVQNTGPWSVFMGSNDPSYRGAAASVRLEHRDNAQGHFAVDESTGDAYAIDHDNGVVRMDGATGQVEQLLRIGSMNLPDDGLLSPDSAVPDRPALIMGVDGNVYIGVEPETGGDSSVIYQYNPTTRRIRRYLGGGEVSDDTATPDTVFAHAWHFDIDEDGSLYFLSRCGNGALRLLRALQADDGSAGDIEIVAGDCSTGLPDSGPSDPLASPLGIDSRQIANITVWGRGSRIFYGGYNDGTWKIIDGVHYSSDINTGAAEALAYDPATETLLAADVEIRRYRPNLLGPDGDTLVDTVVSSEGVGDCTRNGVPALQACIHTEYSMQIGANGTLYFADGASLNEERPYRLRFLDSDNLVQTYLGAKSFTGEGGAASVVRGTIAGIHYKSSSAPNQSAFPEGLYFLDSGALVFGHVAEGSEEVSVLWGTQSGTAVRHQTGDPIGPSVGLGVAYAGGNMETLAFDEDGLPWIRYGPEKNRAVLVRVDEDKNVVALQGGNDDWELAPDGSDPFETDLWPYGTQHNLALSGHTAFLTGSYESTNTTAVMKALDFAGGVVRRVIGAAPNAVSADSLTPGTAVSASLPESCHFNGGDCWIQYRSDEDRLYFTENDKIRYITSPSNSAVSTLGTLWDSAPSSIRNFTFSPDRTMLLYLNGGQLSCHDLGGAPAWCDETSLGPPPIVGSISSGPNQLTWKGSSTLLVSTFRGEVLAFDVSP